MLKNDYFLLLASFFFSLRPPSKESYYWWSKPGSLFPPPPPPLPSADRGALAAAAASHIWKRGGREGGGWPMPETGYSNDRGRKENSFSPPSLLPLRRQAAAIGRRLRPPLAARRRGIQAQEGRLSVKKWPVRRAAFFPLSPLLGSILRGWAAGQFWAGEEGSQIFMFFFYCSARNYISARSRNCAHTRWQA